MMEKDRLIEIMTSALDNGLCGGCKHSVSPYAYENGGSCDGCRSMAAIEITSIIRRDTPSVDAVEVVRCKDCKWWDALPASTAAPAYHECKARAMRVHTTADEFCSRGERKDGEEG